METVLGLFKLLLILFFILLGLVLWGYNKLRASAERVKEAWSNIGVAAKKQVSLVNQLIEVVKSYQDNEKFIQLKISENDSVASVQEMVQRSGTVLSAMSGIVQRFPELKANEQYNRLTDSIQAVENQLHAVRAGYNARARDYNVLRAQIPYILFAPALGFSAAPYLSFEGGATGGDIGQLGAMVGDDGERLRQMLGSAAQHTLAAGRSLSGGLLQAGKALADKVSALPAASADAPLGLPPIPSGPAAQQYFYLDADEQPNGPHTLQKLRELHEKRIIHEQTLLGTRGATKWLAFAEVVQLASAGAPDLPPLPPPPKALP